MLQKTESNDGSLLERILQQVEQAVLGVALAARVFYDLIVVSAFLVVAGVVAYCVGYAVVATILQAIMEGGL